MKIGFGLITCQRYPHDDRTDVDIYREAVELSMLAEECGFDSVWTSEHHFVDDGYMPSLLVLSAAIAQATTRVQIGTGLLLAPLHHPLRVAEDAATVQVLSGGRFILGIGAGWREEEFNMLGVSLGDRASIMREFVSILRKAWSGAPFCFSGRHFNFEEVLVTPQPQTPIPIWMGGFADAAIKRAGRIGDGFLGSSSGTTGIEGFLRAKQVAGGPPGFKFALHVPVFAWTDGDPWETIKPWYHYMRWKYTDMRGPRSSSLRTPAALGSDEEDSMKSAIICGSPDEVIDQISEFRDALGDDTHFICRSYFPGLPREDQREAVRILGARVLPRFR